MRLSKKQKRTLISIPIVFIMVVGMVTLFGWLLEGDQEAIGRYFRAGIAGAIGGSLLPLLSLLFNWPTNLKD